MDCPTGLLNCSKSHLAITSIKLLFREEQGVFLSLIFALAWTKFGSVMLICTWECTTLSLGVRLAQGYSGMTVLRYSFFLIVMQFDLVLIFYIANECESNCLHDHKDPMRTER